MPTLAPLSLRGHRSRDRHDEDVSAQTGGLTMRTAVKVLVLFAALTAVLTFPLSVAPGSRALDLGADTRLFLWTLGWDLHALANQPFSLFEANIFFPQTDTLAYSEHLLGSALLAAPSLALTDNPVFAMNAVLLITCVGAGVGTYFLARRIGIGPTGAFVAGVVFAFAPPRFFRLGQLHLANVMWTPLCLAFLHGYVRRGRRRDLLIACFFFTLQALSGGQVGLFLLMASVGWLAYARVFGLLSEPRRKLLVDAALACALLLVLNAPFLLPYLSVQREAGLRRSLAEAQEWSPNAASFLAAPTHAQRLILGLYPGLERRILGTARAYLFPGFLTLLLAGSALRKAREAPPPISDRAPPQAMPRWIGWLDIALIVTALMALLLWATGGVRFDVGSLTFSGHGPLRAGVAFILLLFVRLVAARGVEFRSAYLFRRLVKNTRRVVESRMGIEPGYYLFLVFFSLWISLGPRFGLYSALYRMLPGFDFVRVPSRFTMLTVLGLSILAGVGMDKLVTATRARRRGWISVIVVVALVMEFAAFPLDAPAYAIDIPRIDRWIAEQARTQGLFALVELPVPDPRDGAQSARWHSIFMIHSTAHWQPLVNGYSGFTPAEQDALFRKLASFPDEASLDALERLGVSYAVIHRAGYGSTEWEKISERLATYGDRLRLEVLEDGDAVYALTRRTVYLPDRGS